MHARPAHVGVDEQHLGAAAGERRRQIARRRGLAFERLRAGDQDDGPALTRAQGDRGPQRADGLAEIVVSRERWAIATDRRRNNARKGSPSRVMSSGVLMVSSR